MAKSRAEKPKAAAKTRAEMIPLGPRGYFAWSADPAVGLFAVLPLWLLYEGLRLWLAPQDRNGAEVLLLQEIDRLGRYGLAALRIGFAILLYLAARSLVRRNVPWIRVAAVLTLEGTVYGLLLGPSAAAMTSSAVRLLDAGAAWPAGYGLVGNLVGSLGAGIFEELVFRLGLMSLIVWLGMRLVQGSSLPRWVVGIAAVVVSALVFSWFHHLCGEPFDRTRFVFRAMAGVLLGFLMWVRGYGICVYTHTFYDVHYYLTQT
ncbi:MAG: CPBP family intramembrane metalloprotease [Planctomycetes bacterium]|nr:CPBP family intramembrane metalloprotease [Planctomycetota bacterium]